MKANRDTPPHTNTGQLLPVWLLPSMCPQMSCEVRRSGEDLATVPGAEGREVGEALGWSTLPFSRFLMQSPASEASWLVVGTVMPESYLVQTSQQSTEQTDGHHFFSLGAVAAGIREP